MRVQRRFEGVALLVLTLLCPQALAADADDIDAAKRAGVVGEQLDGYLGLVRPDATAQVKALVAEINGKRRRAYQEIAVKNGTPVDAVAGLAGEKLVSRAPPGQFVKDATGAWKRK